MEIEVRNNIAPERALCGLAATACTDGRFGRTEEGTYTKGTLFETPKVKLTKVELGPGCILARLAIQDTELLIALTRIHFTDGTGSDIEKDLGETQAYPTATNHEIKNIGPETVRFLVLEVK